MTNQDRLLDLLIVWGEARDAGRDLSAEELCADSPELEAELTREIERLQALDPFLDLSQSPGEPPLALPSAAEMLNSAAELLPETALRPDEFTRAVTESGLLGREQIEPFRQHASHPNARELAQELVRQKKLTPYQARVLLEGRDQPLLIDRYLILDEIGSGGMGAVFKAVHRQMDRVVAIKILPKAAFDSPDKVKRFQQEIRAAGRLHHPHIVVAHDAYESGGIHFLVMEYVPGENLEQLVYRQGPLSLGKAVRYVRQAAEGLAYAHGQGVIHRDIKPSNLLVSPRGGVKILDLGLARIEVAASEWHHPLSQDLTRPGLVMGTAPYLPPEQALDTHRADARSDIYSLGCTLHFLLMGRPMYLEDTLMKTLVAHREHPIPSLRKRRADVPRALEALFQNMVAKDPNGRPQSVQELLQELNRLQIPEADEETDDELPPGGTWPNPMNQETQTGTVTESDTKPASSTPHFRRRSPWWISGFLGLLGLLIVLGIVFRFRTPAGTIVLEMDQADLAGAIVSIDGERKLTIQPGTNQESIEIQADEKTHTLKVSKGGFETFTKRFTVKAGGKQTLQVRLEPLPNAASPQNSDQDRQVAEWVLEHGGHLGLRIPATGDYQKVTSQEELPASDYHVETVGMFADKATLQDADLKRFQNLPMLTTLTLNEQHKLTGAGFSYLDRLPKLQKVFVLGTRISDRGLKELTRFPNLTHLYAGGPEKLITDAGVPFLADLPRLTELQLGECRITNEGLKVLEKLPNLKLLRIYATPITAPGLEGIQKANPDCRIETDVPGFLPLPSHNRLTQDRLVAEWVLKAGGDVGLEGEGYGFKGFQPQDSLPTNEFRLITAGMDSKVAQVTDEDLKKLDNLPHFTTIILNGQDISDRGLANMGRLSQLQKLYMRGTKVTDAGLKHLTRYPRLTHLHLSGSKVQITDAGIRHLLRLKELTQITFGTCQLTRRGLAELGTLPNLRTLEFDGPSLSQEDLEWFHQTHHKIQIRSDYGVLPAIDPTEHFRRNREVTEWVRSLGGDVSISGDQIGYRTLYAKDPLPPERFSLVTATLVDTQLSDADLRRFHDLEYFGKLVIRSTQLTDAGVIHLGRLPKLDYLSLIDSEITDRGLGELKRFPELAVLHLVGRKSRITDRGLNELSAFKKLKELRLDKTPITDAGLALLGRLPALKELHVYQTQVTRAGLEQFYANHPNCYIESDFGVYPARSPGNRPPVAIAQASPERAARQSPDRRVAQWIHELGGVVGIAGGDSPFRDLRPSDNLPSQPFVIVTLDLNPPTESLSLAPEDFRQFHNLPELTTLVFNGTNITDQGLANLGTLPKLDKLYLGGTAITDQGLKELARYPELAILHVGGSKGRISDQGIQTIAQLNNLVELSLVNCPITDAALQSLSQLPHLRRVIISRTDMTAAGLQAFHRTNPKRHITSDFGVFASQTETKRQSASFK